MIAPTQIQLAHDIALSVGIAVLLYAFIVRPLALAINHILRRSPQRKDTSNDQPVRRGPSASGGPFFTDDERAVAFREGFQYAVALYGMDFAFPRGEGERHLRAVPTDERTAELLHFPSNEKTAS